MKPNDINFWDYGIHYQAKYLCYRYVFNVQSQWADKYFRHRIDLTNDKLYINNNHITDFTSVFPEALISHNVIPKLLK